MLDEIPKKHYKAIVADPPWHFKSRTALQMRNFNSARDVEKHYPVMKLDDIKALPVKEIAHQDCHLFLWATGPCLAMAFDVMSAWGFRYSTDIFVWVKLRPGYDAMQLRCLPLVDNDLHVGLGLTSRKNVEYVLLGRHGNACRNAKDIRQVILSPVREHSRKPDEMFSRVMRYCDGPYLELFSRENRPGWDAWGNEVGKFGDRSEMDSPRSEAPRRSDDPFGDPERVERLLREPPLPFDEERCPF